VNPLQTLLRHHVTGAIERGQAVAVVEKPAFAIDRDMRGSLRAQTRVPLGADRRELHVTTSKGFRGLQCTAIVVQIADDGRSHSHAMSFGANGGDFSRRLSADPAARCTEKTIRATHEAALQQLPDLLQAAHAHYVKREG
jgi:hypothetical protein